MAITLTYGRETPRQHVFRFARRHAVPIAAVAIVFGVLMWRGTLTQPIARMYRQSQIGSVTHAPTVFVDKLLKNQFIGPRHREVSVPKAWTAFAGHDIPVPEPVVFMGVMRAANGKERIVVVTMRNDPPTRAAASKVELTAKVFSAATLLDRPTLLWTGTPFFPPSATTQALEVFAGARSAKDPAVATIRYRIDVIEHEVGIVLNADDTVTLTAIPRPAIWTAGTAPAAPATSPPATPPALESTGMPPTFDPTKLVDPTGRTTPKPAYGSPEFGKMEDLEDISAKP